MRFSKTDNIYKIIRITGSQDNILGISFAGKDTIEDNIEVIEWDLKNNETIKTSKAEVRAQVLSGLRLVISQPGFEDDWIVVKCLKKFNHLQ